MVLLIVVQLEVIWERLDEERWESLNETKLERLTGLNEGKSLECEGSSALE